MAVGVGVVGCSEVGEDVLDKIVDAKLLLEEGDLWSDEGFWLIAVNTDGGEWGDGDDGDDKDDIEEGAIDADEVDDDIGAVVVVEFSKFIDGCCCCSWSTMFLWPLLPALRLCLWHL